MERAEFEKFASGIRPLMLKRALSMLGNSDDAADVVQDSMLKLWFFRQRLDDYRSPEAPAMVILRRECINRLRLRHQTEDLESVAALAADESEEIDPDLMAALASLPTVEQTVLRMKHIDEMEVEEIASLIASTPGAVRTALCRARKKVRDRYLKIKS